MRRRTRFFAGIFALGAMTAALAEGIMASACAPGMQMDIATMAMPDEAAWSGDSMSDMAEPGERSDLPEDGRHCPFAPIASAQGCLAIASIPASSATVASPSAHAGGPVGFDDEQQDLLLETKLFHPPRA